jgi:uncharacterized protein YjbI with pentapeptide repeats
VNLERADLSNGYLQYASLSRADLSEANLRHARLERADLWVANYYSCGNGRANRPVTL